MWACMVYIFAKSDVSYWFRSKIMSWKAFCNLWGLSLCKSKGHFSFRNRLICFILTDMISNFLFYYSWSELLNLCWKIWFCMKRRLLFSVARFDNYLDRWFGAILLEILAIDGVKSSFDLLESRCLSVVFGDLLITSAE